MERRQLSIEPYIDQGGILGTQLEVNEKAASSVMKRTALRADVFVAKGYGWERNNIQGSDELTVSKSKSIFTLFTNDKEPLSELVFSKDHVWIINVNDQLIHNNVDDRMRANFKKDKPQDSGQEMYNNMFVKKLNEEVSCKINEAFWQDKKERFIYSTGSSIVHIVFVGVGISGLYFGSRIIVEGGFETGKGLIKDDSVLRNSLNLMKTGAGVLIFTVGAAFIGSVFKVHMEYPSHSKEFGISWWEEFIPNLQIPSIVAGNISLSLNGNKLIKLKD